MKQAKRSRNVVHHRAGSQTQPKSTRPRRFKERFPNGGGWDVSVTRGPRLRAAYPTNLAKRDAAVADLRRAAAMNKLFIWGAYENQRSTLQYAHGEPACPNSRVVFLGTAAKLARGQLACGCNRRAAASERALDLTVIHALAEAREGKLLSEKYVNNRTKLRWQCADGHQFLMPYDDAVAGRWCPQCSNSKANVLCAVILRELLNVDFEPEQTPHFLATACRQHRIRSRLRLDGWCESERIGFEHQGPQHCRPLTLGRAAGAPTDTGTAQRKFDTLQRYDAIKVAAARGVATLILIEDISSNGYGYSSMPFIVGTVVAAVRKVLPQNRLGGPFEASMARLTALDETGWQQLIKPIFTGSPTFQRVRDLASAKGGKVITFTDDRHVKLECCDGHRWTAQINNVLGGTWCPVHGRQARAKKRRMDARSIRTRLRDLGLRLNWTNSEFASRYRNNQTPLPVTRKSCGGLFERPLAKLHPGSRCPGCKNRTVCTGSTKKGKSRKDSL
jgi:hypothetical protein